jgi:glycerol-3-phosphate acyltransferase PlsY
MTGPVDGFSMTFLLVVIGSYLLGSIPFGLVLTRLAGLGDIRSIGSGSIGATNVLRSGRKDLAAATVILDSGKGWLAVYVVGRDWGFVEGLDAGLFAGLATVIGHNFPIWLKFRGGKGVATTLGVLLGAYFPAGVAACIVWLITAAVFRYSSLAALVGLAAAPVYAFWAGAYPVMITAGVLAILSIVRHRANIERLMRGEESKIGG